MAPISATIHTVSGSMGLAVARPTATGRPPRRLSLGATASARREVINQESQQRGLAEKLAAAAVGSLASLALLAGAPAASHAIGPQNVPLDVSSYSLITCPAGISKDTKCLEVKAEAESKANKSAYNSEVFGKVRYKSTGESALYGDFAEASDAGKMSDIAGEIAPGKTTVSFLVKLQGTYSEDQELSFIGLKARAYPGMRQDFRIMKPVTATEDCPEAELGEECEDIPF